MLLEAIIFREIVLLVVVAEERRVVVGVCLVFDVAEEVVEVFELGLNKQQLLFVVEVDVTVKGFRGL